MATKKEIKLTAPTGELARYLSAPYVRMIIPNAEEGGYLAEVLELPGCITEGDTLEEAYRNLEDAMAGWIRASLDTNRPVPEPVGDKEYSGHFPLRMSTELHRAAALRAMQEGVSLNQWIARAIAEKVGKENLAEDLADKIAPKVADQISLDVSARVDVKLRGAKVGDTDFNELWRTPFEPSQEEITGASETLLAYLADVTQVWRSVPALLQRTQRRPSRYVQAAARARKEVNHNA
jgi:antitoxin HicB